MFKELAKSIREYKRPTILSPIFVTGEVVMEALIPYTIALLVNEIKNGCGLDRILPYGIILLAYAFASLFFGYMAGIFVSEASCGFAKNLRHDVFYNVQEFSFSNIDKFSSASLVTRLTTDIQNVQMAFMMLIRTAFRAPLNLIFSFCPGVDHPGKKGEQKGSSSFPVPQFSCFARQGFQSLHGPSR